MTRRPDDTEPEPPGGYAAERLREMIEGRFPDGLPREGSDAPEEKADPNDDEPYPTARKSQ